MDSFWRVTDQVRVFLRLTYLCRSNCPLLKFSFPDFLCCLLRYWLEILYMNWSWHSTDRDGICRVLLTFTRVIVFCWNLVFQNFLCRLLISIHWIQIGYMNLSSRSSDKGRLVFHSIFFYLRYFPLLKFSFPNFSVSENNLRFCRWIFIDIIQIKFKLRPLWSVYVAIMPL